MKLIVGLGNPGSEYAGNRHNVGFMVIKNLARRHRIQLSERRALARLGMGMVENEKIILARPGTYVNNSGESVAKLCNLYRVSFENVIIIHDDLDLPLGTIRLKMGGGPGGHNGIKSIIRLLGKREFCRVRIGIGRLEYFGTDRSGKESAVIDHVLSNFTDEERKIIVGIIPMAADAVATLVIEGLEQAMQIYN
ncbi:aminoacyl-tRNA hydrolase [Chloroflexota bacterium]